MVRCVFFYNVIFHYPSVVRSCRVRFDYSTLPFFFTFNKFISIQSTTYNNLRYLPCLIHYFQYDTYPTSLPTKVIEYAHAHTFTHAHTSELSFTIPTRNLPISCCCFLCAHVFLYLIFDINFNFESCYIWKFVFIAKTSGMSAIQENMVQCFGFKFTKETGVVLNGTHLA